MEKKKGKAIYLDRDRPKQKTSENQIRKKKGKALFLLLSSEKTTTDHL